MAASPTHDSRCGIRNISKFLGCEPHPLLCLPTNAGMVGKRPTNRSYRKIELRAMCFIVITICSS